MMFSQARLVRRLVRRFSLCFLFVCVCITLTAQELSDKQKVLADRYSQLEQILFRMSEATASSNPPQAVLLKKVLQAGKEKLVTLRLGQITGILERKQFTDALTGQESVEKDLLELLKLWENADREQKRTADKEQIKEFLRNLEEIIHQEKNLKTKTTQEDEKKITPLEKEQKDVRKNAETLRDKIARSENSEKKNQESGEKSQDKEEQKSEEQKSEEQKTEERKIGEQKQGEQKDREQKDGDKQQKNGEKQEEKSGENEEQKADTPTQQAMQKALQRMKQAEEKLNKAEKSGALEEQEEAVAELQRVKAELEKILRQLREEELLQTLEKLEARFKRMLTVEQGIRTKTETLSNDKAEDETAKRQRQIQSGQLAADQITVMDDADAAMILLREDGTAQALAESLLQARFDMEDAKNRLEKTELNTDTLDVEDAVISALKEMLEAVQLAIKEAEKRQEREKNKPGGSPNSKNDVEPLIQLLSELKMIRSMQQRVNDRTERYDRQIEEKRQQPNPDWGTLPQNVDELARQQNRITRILHDLKVGKTE
ncbi:MAG: hypothetical protein LBN39_01065 [Planctomycetaceae bacterium]|jgi:hypothetical protein|nr:hypothetical protein [Planctomycetaceae bacterium]